ncbi:MAG: sigma-70 family RNA polymerase sigma factor [Bacteroidetes bacterium]|nr:sigma-70 family RNA polymerase sigma factor [Bacteroidota bacterium]
MTDNPENTVGEPDHDWLSRIAAGDQAAFAEIVRRYWNTIYSHALAYLKSAPRAEEITQDVFLKLWTTRLKLPEVRSLDNYIFIIARNHIFNETRKKIGLVYGEIDDRAETSALPDLQTEYKESYQLLLKGIELLPEKRRVVFKLSRLEGLTNEQIAVRLGIHKDTVYQYLVKSLLFLRAYLQEHFGDTLLVLFLITECRRGK